MKEILLKVIPSFFKELLIVLIIRFIHILLHFDIFKLVRDNLIISISLSYLVIYNCYVLPLYEQKISRKKYYLYLIIPVFLIGIIIDLKFAIFTLIWLYFTTNKEERLEIKTQENIKQYFEERKNKRHII